MALAYETAGSGKSGRRERLLVKGAQTSLRSDPGPAPDFENGTGLSSTHVDVMAGQSFGNGRPDCSAHDNRL